MMTGNEKAALLFSGGKDSRALLEMARPHLDRITVLFSDTGAVYPHVRQYVEDTCKALSANLAIVKPPEAIEAYHERVGLPSDIVPIESLAGMVPMLRERPKQLLQGYMACCSKMLFEPMADAIKASGIKIVLRGSKKSDARVGVGDRHVEDGIEYRSPLWDWSDSDVMAYLDREGVTLPAHYSDVPDSLDCWSCPAHLAHHGAAKLKWTRENYPDLFPIAAERVRRVKHAIFEQADRVNAAWLEADIR